MNNEQQKIWNRAAMERGGNAPGPGDMALKDLLLSHGLIMSGGVLDTVENLSDEELDRACRGYRFFGFVNVALLLDGVKTSLGNYSEREEEKLNCIYSENIPDDGTIVSRFLDHLSKHPNLYSHL